MMDIDVSFSKEVFTKDDFDVDKFLQESCQKSGLHKLHKELGVYIKYLQSMIVDLVNNESTAIVHLSSELKVLQDKFNDIGAPLGQLHEEFLQIYKMVESNLTNINYLLTRKQQLSLEKSSKMNELRMLITSQKIGTILKTHQDDTEIQMEVIERSVNQYILQRMYSQLCRSEKYTFKNTDTLYKILNNVFLKAILDVNTTKCTSCLQMYMLMNAQNVAENIYRTEVVKPAMYEIINENMLKMYDNDLSVIYKNILDFVHNKMNYLLTIINKNHEIIGFNFVLNSVWSEVSEQLKLSLSCIYAPGVPGVFHQRFRQTVDFLNDFEKCFVDEMSQKEFRKHESYRKQYQQWNLKIYFEIRQMEIIEAFEKCLSRCLGRDMLYNEPKEGFMLLQTRQAWKTMEKCFQSDIYLPQLLDKFWKLTLQIVSRLNVWISTLLKNNLPVETNAEAVVIQENITETKLKFLSYSHIDITTFQNRLSNGLNSDGLYYLRNNIPPVLIEKIILSLDVFVKNTFPKLLKTIRDISVNLIYKECSVHVKNVSQIPRLYRKTNRNTPTTPSSYVIAMCKPIEDFKEYYGGRLGSDIVEIVVKSVYEEITFEYRKLVENVLTSVAKTEESLRRLKKTRGNVDNPESSDDQKIRMQVQLDVNAYGEKAGKFVDVTALLLLVKDTTPPKE